MISVLGHHFLYIFQSLRLPCLVAYMLPAGDLGYYQKADLVTAVKEVMGLGIMGCADGIETKLSLQNIGVKLLHGFWHSVAHIGVGLMAVKAADLQLLAV